MKPNAYAETLRNLPDGLVRAVARVLTAHWGRANAIRRSDLLRQVRAYPGLAGTRDRLLRKAIEDLRGEGLMIGNIGDGAGYYMITSREEYAKFKVIYRARANVVLHNIAKMDESAAQQFGEDPTTYQPRML